MKKKSGWKILLLALIAAGVIVAGVWHSKKLQEQLEEKSLVHASDGKQNESSASNGSSASSSLSKEEKLTEYKKRLDSLSVLEYLDYRQLDQGTTKIAFFGDLSESDGWVRETVRKLNQSLEEESEVVFGSYPKTDTYELYIQQTTASLSDDQPDVVFFRPSPNADRVRDIGLAETEEYLQALLSSLEAINTDGKVILVESLSSPASLDVRNSRSLSSDNYATRMKTIAEEAGVMVLPIRDAVEEAGMAEEQYAADLFEPDGATLNDKGSKQYADWIWGFISDSIE